MVFQFLPVSTAPWATTCIFLQIRIQPVEQEFAELKPLDSESKVIKKFPGSFTGTDLQDLLVATGRKKIVITG